MNNMGMNHLQEGGVVVRGRVEIDMRQPFRSVKEAVSLFGEKVLAGEVYANKLKEMQTNKGNITGEEKNSRPKIETVVSAEPAEPEETKKQSLEKSKEEENQLMAYYLCSLRKELEETKKELQQLKSSKELISDNHHLYHHLKIPNPPDPVNEICTEIEELKFIENSTTKKDIHEAKTQPHHQVHHQFELEKKRSVKFASPPLLTRVIISKDDQEMQSSPSVNATEKKPKRKPLIPVLGFLFSRKKGHQKNGAESLRA
ncbi:OLC1v1011035C1 [Oldenlandia corymbosa var. corymbosa]|uniref:OLC1v1011035C1 n=1 Tax=Oldenlandia corymbosa var. corymbosa TaxID=529605 RepID=A0AAV1DSN5_OLDCO|nr:OLC1v1011035C1 [Oldenlandia corymbosa var. corymbosa]